MAYGKQALRPGKSSAEITPLDYPEVKKMQKGKTGQEGADLHDFGGMPSSGPVMANAESGEEGRGPTVTHGVQKTPKAPQKPGGAKVGSVDTMTNLVFHPKGGLGTKTAKTPKSSGGFKESGQRGKPKSVGVH